MKTTITLTIESPDEHNVLPEDFHDEDSNYDKSEEGIKEIHKQFAKDVHSAVVKTVESMIDRENIEEHFFDDCGYEVYIDSWESFEDYDIKYNSKTEEEE